MDDFSQTAFALFPMSLLGFFTNWFVFQSLLRLRSFRHSFGYLSVSQSLADAIHSTAFLFFFCPMILLNQPLLQRNANHLSIIILGCYELSLYTHLAISINRVCAVWIPRDYSKVFNTRNTIVIIVIIWVIFVSLNFWFYEYLCEIIYDPSSYSLTFGQTETCGYVGLYGDLLKNLISLFLLVIFDVVTLIGVRKTRASIGIGSNAQEKISNREKRFLKQIIVQSIIFVLELSSYFFIPQLTNDPTVFFFSTTFAYCTVHVLDGLCMIVIYPDIRLLLFCKKHRIQTSSLKNT